MTQELPKGDRWGVWWREGNAWDSVTYRCWLDEQTARYVAACYTAPDVPHRPHFEARLLAVPYSSQHDCPCCTCGRRAPVQKTRLARLGDPGSVPGSITWAEHEKAWMGYAAQYPGQSAQRMAERGGFSYGELIMFLGKDPETWVPRGNEEALREAWAVARAAEAAKEQVSKLVSTPYAFKPTEVRPGHHPPCPAMLDDEAVCICGQ